MTVQTSRPNDGTLPLFALLGGMGIALAAWAPFVVAAHLAGRTVPINPWELIFGLADGSIDPPGPGVLACYAAEAVVIVVALLIVLRRRAGRSIGRNRADAATRHLSGPSDMIGLTPAQVRESAKRLRPGADPEDPAQHGVMVMETVSTRTPLRMSWEDIAVVIAGPRVGKTTANVVPAIVGYRGPLKASSNKPDVHDATRGPREELGRCWVVDPQDLVDGPDGAGDIGPAFWWDPLADVLTLSIAREVVQILIDTSIGPDSKPDAYFHPTGRSVLVNYVFAAAIGGKCLADVDAWLGDINDTEAQGILRDGGYPTAAEQIRSVLSKPDRQRDGVVGTAQSWLSVLSDPKYAAWINPPSAADEAGRPRFDPGRFVRSEADTVYLLSQEGPASAAFITTALNASIDRAALEHARTLPGRRLANPVLSVLDEAANTIRDTALPDKVSHYGSRGLPTMIVLQSYSQGVEVWGDRGMRKLWSAANIKLYLGGVGETEFLKTMCDLLGDRDERYWTSSTSRAAQGGHSRSSAEQIRRLPIMSVAELASLPRGRAVLFSSGNRPAIGRPVPWMAGPHAQAIRDSLDKWESQERRDARWAQDGQAAIEVLDTEGRDAILRDDQLRSAIENEGVLL